MIPAFKAGLAGLILALSLPGLEARAEDPAVESGGAPILGTAAIEGLLVGNTLAGRIAGSGERWIEFYCDTGRSIYLLEGEVTLGKWRIADDTVCFRYAWDDYQEEGCFSMARNPDRGLTLVRTKPLHDRSYVFVSGPPEAGDPYRLTGLTENGCRMGPGV